jgi:hypothetical protein
MKTRSFVVTAAALWLAAIALATGGAIAEQKVVNISKKYSKLQLEAICTREGGAFYGNAEGSYGCTKGPNTVECHNDGSCKGYTPAIYVLGGGTNDGNSAEAVLQQSPGSAKQGTKTGTTGGALTTP